MLQRELPESPDVGMLLAVYCACQQSKVIMLPLFAIAPEWLQALQDAGQGAGKSITEEELTQRKSSAVRAWMVQHSFCTRILHVHERLQVCFCRLWHIPVL